MAAEEEKKNKKEDFTFSENLENPWETLSSAKEDAPSDPEEDKDDFRSAFKEFKKTFTFKILVVVVALAVFGGVGWSIYALATADFASGDMSLDDFSAYYEQNSSTIWTYTQISLFALVMFIFAARDHVSFKKGQHLESKSIIISLGIAGTFLGIFLGLQGFDTNDVTGSVPKLLDGLKLAFSTSILGMFINIPLTAMQQMPNVDSKSEMRTLMSIDEKLSSVEQVPEMAQDMKRAMEAIVDMKTEIKENLIEENSNRTNEILGQISSRSAKKIEILTALEMGISSLAKATKEMQDMQKNNNTSNSNSSSPANRVTGAVPSVYE